MRKIFRLARLCAFAAFILLPAFTLVAFTHVLPYGRPFSPLPSFRAVITSAAGRTSLTASLLEHSILTMGAIKAQNRFAYLVSGYVDTPQVISGIDGWLFYKPDFWGGQCLPASFFATHLAYADALQDVADAAGLNLVISVSPDKSTIYPEKFHPAARVYWRCKSENAALWRRIAATSAPRIIDHAKPILAEKRSNPNAQLFFVTDTHWTPLAAALARRQLFTAMADGKLNPLPAPQPLTDKFLTRPTDLRNVMLLLDGTDSVPFIDPDREKAFMDAATKVLHPGNTVVLRDSFYLIYQAEFQPLLPIDGFFNPESEADKYLPLLRQADTVIVNSVERDFFTHLDHALSWTGVVGATILARNEKRAGRCTGFHAAQVFDGANFTPHNVSREATGAWHTTGADPWIPVSVPNMPGGQFPCVSLAIKTDSADFLEIFLPIKGGAPNAPMFEAGRSMIIPLTAGTNEIQVVLPTYVAGLQIRIDPASGSSPAHVSGLGIGTLPTDAPLELPPAAPG